MKASPTQCWSCAHTLLQGYTSSALHSSEAEQGHFLRPLSVCAAAASDTLGCAARAAGPGEATRANLSVLLCHGQTLLSQPPQQGAAEAG